jgi:hypothetical protein
LSRAASCSTSGKIHLAVPGDGQAELEKAIEVDLTNGAAASWSLWIAIRFRDSLEKSKRVRP